MSIRTMPIARRRRSAVMAVSAATMFLCQAPASAQSCLPDTLKGQVLVSFSGGADGWPTPNALVFREGALYGTTDLGGRFGLGSVYKLTPPAAPGANWTKSDILWFRGSPDGANPLGLVLDSSGSLYGVTYTGGAMGQGTAYKATPPVPPVTAWAKRLIHSFRTEAGWRPTDSLIVDTSGALYGVNAGWGAVYKLSPPTPPSTQWTHTIIDGSFHSGGNFAPRGPLLLRDGEIFGVSSDRTDMTLGHGSVFRLTPPVAPATAWTKTVIHRFEGWPVPGSLVFDTAGALYGVTQNEGAFGGGAVFKLTPSTGTAWVYSVLYNFKNAPDARNPSKALVFDSAGALYGVAPNGGAHGLGAVFRLKPPVPPSTVWTESVVYSFKGGPDDGATPITSLIFDTNGALYGATSAGGAAGKGVVFRLSR